MKIYILRHAIAVTRGTTGFVNDDRPLTADGIKKMKKAALGILKNVKSIDIILTSPLQRAHHTAEIVAETFHYGNELNISKNLLPGAAPKKLLDELSTYNNKKSIMVVGHNPHLENFASMLIGSNVPVIELKKGGLCTIEVDELPPRNPGRLLWHLTPKQLRSLA